MSVIRLNEITKKYGNFKALDKLTLEFEMGQQYAVLGASGSGKSTMLYLMGGLDRPTRGEITIDGMPLFKKSDKELALFRNRHVGFIFQFHFLLPGMTCMDNILLPAQIGGLDAGPISKRCLELADHLQVSHCLKKFPHQLSGGEQQRINVIRALSLKPKMLLCDEPTGNLDSENTVKVTKLLRDLASEFAATLIVVTHDSAVVEAFDHKCQLRDGKLV